MTRTALCTGLQPGELPPVVGAAETRQALVVDDAAGEADQDRREGGDAREVRHLPDGRGCRAQATVPGDPGADWTAASA